MSGLKLLTEFIDFKEIKVIQEKVDGGCHGSKDIKFEGPFLQAETENRNKRRYGLDLLTNQVKIFNEEKISKNRALGELDHPPTPQINLDRVSHKIENLEMQGNIGFGKAKVIDTPVGRILKTLIAEGIVLGVSTRGVGTIDEKSGYVNDDFQLITVDVVADPSAPKAFVDAVMESKQWIMQNGVFVEKAFDRMEKTLDNGGSKAAYNAMITFLDDIRRKI